jgi:SsrA-binding protein
MATAKKKTAEDGAQYSGQFAENRRARFDYEILETYTAGIELTGFEVKGIRNGKCSIAGAYALVRNGKAEIVGMTIDPVQPKNVPEDYEPRHNRKLLLKKDEMTAMERTAHEHGGTIIPLSVFAKKNLIKIDLGIARGKKDRDKRQVIKKRQAMREARNS